MLAIEEDDKKTFADLGFIVIKNLLSKEEVRCCLNEGNKIERKAIKNNIPNPDFSFEPGMKKLRAVFKVRQYSSYISDLPEKKMLVNNILEKLMDYKKYSLVGTMFWLKKTQTASFLPWHQDLAYYRKTFKDEHDFGVNLWIALDRATTENGCLQIIPQSHKSNLVPHNKINNESRETFLEIDTKKIFPNIIPLSIELNPGDAVLFNWLCAHRSSPNFSKKSRRAISFGFLMHK